MVFAVIALSILLTASLAACAYLWAQRKALMAERDALVAQRDGLLVDSQTLAAQKESLVAELGQLRTTVAVAEKSQAQLDQAFQALRQEMESRFKAVAGDVLKGSNEQFLRLAAERLKQEQAQTELAMELRRKEVEALVTPMRQTLEQYQQSLRAIENARQEAYGSLRQQVGAMVEDQHKLRRETANLVTALRRPEVRGRWGEVQLRRVAELAGMIANCDFTEQSSQATEAGMLRPDMIVHLPAGGTIVVDAKTPLDAYVDSLTAGDAGQRQSLLERHATQLDQKVRDLSGKAYWAQFERSPEFVVLFIPGESFLYAAMELRPDLMEKAMERNVVIASPATLIALLKAVAMGWREERLAENAQRISDLGRQLHERLAVAAGHLEDVGGALGRAVEKYNSFIGSFERNVMTSARRFQELGAGSSKELPAPMEPVDTTVRQIGK